ncbi:MAG: hypothetical protein P8105_09420, partial [Dehalococcoidia bacterium]
LSSAIFSSSSFTKLIFIGAQPMSRPPFFQLQIFFRTTGCKYIEQGISAQPGILSIIVEKRGQANRDSYSCNTGNEINSLFLRI